MLSVRFVVYPGEEEGGGWVRSFGWSFFSRWWDFSEGRSGKGKGKGKEGVRKKDGVVHSGRLEREKQSGGGGDGVTSSDNASLFVNFLFLLHSPFLCSL